MATPNDEDRATAKAIVENWHEGYRYLARLNPNGQCATDLIDAISAALAAERAKEQKRLQAFALKFKKQIHDRAWGPNATEVINRVLAELETAAAGKEK